MKENKKTTHKLDNTLAEIEHFNVIEKANRTSKALTTVGNAKAFCPYCLNKIKAHPRFAGMEPEEKKKIKCEHCGHHSIISFSIPIITNVEGCETGNDKKVPVKEESNIVHKDDKKQKEPAELIKNQNNRISSEIKSTDLNDSFPEQDKPRNLSELLKEPPESILTTLIDILYEVQKIAGMAQSQGKITVDEIESLLNTDTGKSYLTEKYNAELILNGIITARTTILNIMQDLESFETDILQNIEKQLNITAKPWQSKQELQK